MSFDSQTSYCCFAWDQVCIEVWKHKRDTRHMSGGEDVGMTNPFTGGSSSWDSAPWGGAGWVFSDLACKLRGGGLRGGTWSEVLLNTGTADLGLLPMCGLGKPPRGRSGAHTLLAGRGSPRCGHWTIHAGLEDSAESSEEASTRLEPNLEHKVEKKLEPIFET